MAAPIFRLVGWDPLASANSGAAFASFLAAVVLGATVQAAAKEAKRGEDAKHEHRLSLAAAPATLVTLLVATYLYIVLSGLNGQVTACLAMTTCALDHGTQYEAIAAAAFSISGTTLAFGALLAIFVVYCVINERTTAFESPSTQWARSAFDVAVFLILYILILGYYVGAHFAGEKTRTLWWLLNASALILPGLVVVAASRLPLLLRPRLVEAANRSHRVLGYVTLSLLAALPAVGALLIVSFGPEHPLIGDNVASLLSGAYYSVGASVLLILARHAAQGRSEREVLVSTSGAVDGPPPISDTTTP